MPWGDELASLDGYAFAVRYSPGSLTRAKISAELIADAYLHLRGLLGSAELDLALIVANRADWASRGPYGLPYFNDDPGQLRPGIVVMSAGPGDFWREMGEDLKEPHEDYARLLATYPDGAGGIDLQPFFDLVTIHELGHAFEVLGGLRLPTYWLSEIFANLVLHTYVATSQPQSLALLETLSLVGSTNTRLRDRVRAEGYESLEDLERHYTGGTQPMDAWNYVWYQYRWQRLAATIFDAEGEGALARFWNYFRQSETPVAHDASAASQASLLDREISRPLAQAVIEWDQK